MNTASYIEADCTVTLQGREFTAGGAVVTDAWVIGYVGPMIDPGTRTRALLDWHGHRIGTCWIVATWATPRSCVSSTMHQIEAAVNGILYTGRGCGEGMIYHGKQAKKQPNGKEAK